MDRRLVLVWLIGAVSVFSFPTDEKQSEWTCKTNINRKMSRTTGYYPCIETDSTTKTPNRNVRHAKGNKWEFCCTRLQRFDKDTCNGGKPECEGRGKRAKITCFNCPAGSQGENCSEPYFKTVKCFCLRNDNAWKQPPNCSHVTLDQMEYCTSRKDSQVTCVCTKSKTQAEDIETLEDCSRKWIQGPQYETVTPKPRISDAAAPATKVSAMVTVIFSIIMVFARS